MDLLIGWVSGFFGQLLVAILLSWALRKLFGVENRLAVCAATTIFAVSMFAMTHDGNVVWAMLIYLPSIIAVYLVLGHKALKPA